MLLHCRIVCYIVHNDHFLAKYLLTRKYCGVINGSLTPEAHANDKNKTAQTKPFKCPPKPVTVQLKIFVVSCEGKFSLFVLSDYFVTLHFLSVLALF